MRWNSQGLLTHIEWSQGRLAVVEKVQLPKSFSDLADRIREYFFRGVPIGAVPWDCLDQSTWSEFQTQVYAIISEIPHGQTRTYGWVAEKLGKSSASRAVGQALKKNPFPIFIPCHRILSTSSIGGFMGTMDPSKPELQLKRRLLLLEEEYISPTFSFLTSEMKWPSTELNQIKL